MLEEGLTLLLGEEIKLCGEVLLLAERTDQAETGVDGGMIQELILAEIDHTHVGCGGGHASSDRDEKQASQK